MIPTSFVFKLCLATPDQNLPATARKYGYTGTIAVEDVYKGLLARAQHSFNLAPGSFHLAILVPNVERAPTPLPSYPLFKSTLDSLLPLANVFHVDGRGRTILNFVVTSKSCSQRANPTATADHVSQRVNRSSLAGSRRPDIHKSASRLLPSRRCTLRPVPPHHPASPVLDMHKFYPQPYPSRGCSSSSSVISSGTPAALPDLLEANVHPPEKKMSCPQTALASQPKSLRLEPEDGESLPWFFGEPQAAARSSILGRGERTPSSKRPCHTFDTAAASIRERRRDYVRAVNEVVAKKLAGSGMAGPHRRNQVHRSTIPGIFPSREEPTSGISLNSQQPVVQVATRQGQSVTTHPPLINQQQNYPYLVNAQHDFSGSKVDTDTKFAGIYHTILSQAFHSNSKYTVCSQVRSGITFIEVHHANPFHQFRPVLIVQCYPSGTELEALGRKKADDGIRVRISELASHLLPGLPRFHGLSICGSKTRFYMLDPSSGSIFPKHEDVSALDHVLPRDFLAPAWSCDLTSSTGISILKSVIADVRAMAEGITISQAQSRLQSLNEVPDQLHRVLSCGSHADERVAPSHDAVHMPGTFNLESSVLENSDGKASHRFSAENFPHTSWPDGLFYHPRFSTLSIRSVLSIGSLGRILHLFFGAPEFTVTPVAPDHPSNICFIVRDSKDRPVFLVQMSSSSLVTARDRHEADSSMRQFYECSWSSCVLPRLHGISVSDDHIRFYTLDTASRLISPASESSASINHVLPRNHLFAAWNYTLQSQECFDKLKHVAADCASMSLPASLVSGFDISSHGSSVSPAIVSDVPGRTEPVISSHDQSSFGPLPEEVVHYGIMCDGCGSTVKGVRARCTDCPDFDLCARCYLSRTDFHAKGHGFALHSTPVPLSDLHEARVVSAHLLPETIRRMVIICDRCSKKITDVRAKCSHSSCPDFDLCAECYVSREEVHPKDHIFSMSKVDGDCSALSESGKDLKLHSIHSDQQPSTAKPTHMADCNLCGNQICGVRWKCLECEDWDCCEECLDGVQAHHPFHQLLPITDPAYIKPCAGADIRHRGVMCDGCDKEIFGIRYKCTHPSCLDYDLCSACESHPIPRHDSDHVMLKIRDSTTWKANSCVAQMPSLFRPHFEARTGIAIATIEGNSAPATLAPRVIRTGYAVVARPQPSVQCTGYAVAVPSNENRSTSSCSGSSSSSEDSEINSPEESRPLCGSVSSKSSSSASSQLQREDRVEEGLLVNVGRQSTSDQEQQIDRISIEERLAEVNGSSLVAVDVPEARFVSEQSEVDVGSVNFNTSTPVENQENGRSLNSMILAPGGSMRSNNLSPDCSFNNTSEFTARYVSDLNFADGTIVTAGSRFTKIWLVHNSGSTAWPEGTKVVFTGGYYGKGKFKSSFSATKALPNEVVEISIDAIAPEEIGDYAQFWRLLDPFGSKFGERLWLRLKVVKKGTTEGFNSESGSLNVAAQDCLSASASFHIPRFTASGTLESSLCSEVSSSPPADVMIRQDDESLDCSSANELLGEDISSANEQVGERGSEKTRSLSIGSDIELDGWVHDEQFNDLPISPNQVEGICGNRLGDEDFEIVTESDSSSF